VQVVEPNNAAAKERSGSKRKTLVGRVVSDKMQKTIVIQIESRKLHPLYKKYITRSKKVKAHDEQNQCAIGDLVRVVESRPMSKDKRWRLVEILEKAK
jgi:small subunit ribosomal protein S17